MFSNTIADRVRLLFRKDKESYLRFYKILGFYPRNISYYEQALLHKSTSVRTEKGRPLNNERLEFLGDAVLDAVVADILYKKYEGKREGFLTNTRSKIVQRETLNRLSAEIGLDKLIKYTTRQLSHNSYMGGNAFEALIGAIYLDRGYAACKDFMEHRIIGPHINLEKLSRKEINFKSKLIEWSQKNHFEIVFELVNQTQEQQGCSPTFESEVLIEGISSGKGTGYSKKESQQEAAHKAMSKIKKDSAFVENLFAAKAKREMPEETVSQGKAEAASVPSIALTEDERQTDARIEQIISEAEEAAFKQMMK